MSTDGRFYELQNREQPRLLAPSLRQEVAQEPDVLALDAAVEQLDFSEVEARYSRVGHPAYPPKVMLKVLLYGYSLGMRSSRHLERACRMDLAFQFLAHGLQPDFRTLCRFRRRHADLLTGLFAQTVRLCQEAGLVALGHVAVDGTKVRANRSGDTLSKVKQALRDALAEAEQADADIPEDEEAAEGADAECDFMKMPEGRKQPAYNAQVAVDGEHQVIVGQGVSAAAADQGQLPGMVEQVRENCRASPSAVSADGGYWTYESMEQVDSDETRVYVPPMQSGASMYEWVAERGAYRCAAGHWLKPYRVRDGRQVYRTHRCTGCPQAQECGVRTRFKEVHVPLPESGPGRVADRMRSAQGQAVYGRRMQIVEPVIGALKHNRGFRRFLLRGSIGAGAEWSLMCMAHNLAKWAQAVLPPSGGPGEQRRGLLRHHGAPSWRPVVSALWRRLQWSLVHWLLLPSIPPPNPEPAAR